MGGCDFRELVESVRIIPKEGGNRLDSGREEHLTEEELTLLIDRRYNRLDGKRAHQHVHHCARCAEDFRDIVRYRGEWEAGAEAFASRRDLVDIGMHAASTTSDYSGVRGRIRRIAVAGSRPARLAALAAGLAVVLAGAFWMTSPVRRSAPAISSEIVAPISAAADLMSSRTLLVIPGSERSIDVTSHVYRSDFIARDESISHSLLALLAQYETEEDSRDVLFWLMTGFLTTGQYTVAQDYAQEALGAFAGDNQMATLVALAYFCAGEKDESERLLREIVERDPEYATAAFNLGVVLLDRNARVEAREFLARAADSKAPLADKARWLLPKTHQIQ